MHESAVMMLIRKRRVFELRGTAAALISLLAARRCYSRVAPPPPAPASVIRVSENNIAYRGPPKEGSKPRQLLALPPFPAAYAFNPLPGRKNKPQGLQEQPGQPAGRLTAITWVKHYFAEVDPTVIQSHFNRGLVQVGCSGHGDPLTGRQQATWSGCNDAGGWLGQCQWGWAAEMVPQTWALWPYWANVTEGGGLAKDSAIIVLNKPPKVPVKGNLPVHNSMDALAAAALSYGNEEGPKLVHRFDVESSGILLMGRTKESTAWLHWLFSSISLAKSSSEAWNNACEATVQRYWALVIGCPKEKEGLICAPLSKMIGAELSPAFDVIFVFMMVILNDGKTERVVLAHPSGIDGSQEAITEYRVLGPTIRGCSWVELRPLTGRKHQLRVHCAEALGTPIVGDYKYGWYIHRRWKQMPRSDYEPMTGEPYRLRRPEGVAVQKGSVLSKVPLLHLHCREMVIPNVAKFVTKLDSKFHDKHCLVSKSDLLRFVAPMPSHMQISWNIMSSYLI
ncbi:hypothetical protein Taro_018612 [Colocasia esculenta]|uniref:Pseudouridine synthase RsuA/RluA-like domain-containing protein n=1 Tax=Colocasia esculenta TaxID=4460 RepID=A0A843UR74_COLES|nr:hypothetical protein [Colocasia esculenta]